jgi:hypothetical protein
MARRNSTADFIRDVAAQTAGTVVFSVTTNTDGTLNVLRNGIRVARCFWPGGAGAVTDINPGGDRVILYSLDDGAVEAQADVQTFLSGLK